MERMEKQKPKKIQVKQQQQAPSNGTEQQQPTIDFKSTTPEPIIPPTSPRLAKPSSARMNCLCSPTTHAGSFRCRFHRAPVGMTRGHSVGSNLSELSSARKSPF